MLHHLILTWFDGVQHWGYLGIILLMAMESSIIPIPSEVVIPPAAYLATQGKMSFWGVVCAGTFGSWLGAAITYWVAFWIGRAVILKWGKWIHITHEKLERAEHFVHRYEAGGIFFSRLLPVIRHLISIPAGIIEMNFAVFSAMTILGSFAWCTVLAWFGAHAITPEMMHDPASMAAAIKHQSHWIVGGIFVFCVLYFVAMKLSAKPGKTKAASTINDGGIH